MIIVVSPAKSLDMESKIPVERNQQPRLLDDSKELIEQLRGMERSTVQDLMSISKKLAQLNVDRYQTWSVPFNNENAKASIFAFQGDVYQGFDANTLSEESLQLTEKRLRILSGLYGILRPLDLMQAYRLEMGTSLENERGKDLYAFWGNKITDLLNEDIQKSGFDYLLNLASVEYFKSINKNKINVPVVSPVFKDEKNGNFKIISFYAKQARGQLARIVIDKDITEPSALKEVQFNGYFYSNELSKDELNPVFIRKESAH
jgi:cytoplasmic iron level regulating protein YaaA (DUF328/UPF0246 family)